MSRRNFILLIIVLIIATTVGLFLLSSPKIPSIPDTDNGGIFSDLNPFKNNNNTKPTTIPGDGTENEVNTTTEETINSQLFKVSSMPVAGYTVFQKENTDKEYAPALRYVDKATGYVYQTFVNEINEKRFSGTIIPKVYEALFGNNGEMVIMRYLKNDNKTIQTFVGNLPKEIPGEETEREVSGYFLPENISDLSVSPDTKKIFYLFNTGDSSIGITSSLENDIKVQVFDSPFTEWLSWWPNDKLITITTKPSYGSPGYIFAINPNEKDFNKLVGNITGLTTLTSPNGKLIFYGNNNLTTSIYNIETRESVNVGINTLPEKCVWNKNSTLIYCAIPKFTPSGQYPDSWYMGEVSFTDEIWKINLENGSSSKIIDPITAIGGEEMDGTKLMLDNNENHLFLVNKKDSYLWKLNLK